jgi:hypothetical protein
MNIGQRIEKPKYFEKPNDDNYYDHNVENSFDFSIHRDISIDEP